MADTTSQFQNWIAYLQENDWVQQNPMSYAKDGIELFFDQSNYIEIYPENDSTHRLDEMRIHSQKDLEALLDRINNGMYSNKDNVPSE
ncbi:hypothetical protein KFE98_03445 [bacterium SCSIO 12741]|nr:hypothetical protein KFE98_03445 [bacterium SCSIO 12741]